MLGRAILVAGFALVASPALPHTAPMGWEYDQECCSGRDCEPVADSAIREVQGGYQVTLLAGQHKMVPEGKADVTQFIPHGDTRIRVSGDGEKHACLSMGGYIYCIYLPPGGV